MESVQLINPSAALPADPNHTLAQAQPFRMTFSPTNTQQQQGFRDQLDICDDFYLKHSGAHTLLWVPVQPSS